MVLIFERPPPDRAKFILAFMEELMQPSDLAFFTSAELIDELMRRNTFLGIVVHSVDEHRQTEWAGERMFRVHFNSNLSADEARGLLDAVSKQIDVGLD
jgi:hypothetical protein